ncbi:hypothetical protein AVEN_175352-1 [Araneus ventricosus]|uniref:Uncharacterized protein n=1 Tax=Araneus ventricosus TaxID=182803 RepID=A0A4Y2HUT2_ARAVE|nr:hypothetical protein AVEN_162441-1 [Araneus ventricosus]GBM70666.1 hypothetical protein AVEN_175352-1 [Araneus ventricosus]
MAESPSKHYFNSLFAGLYEDFLNLKDDGRRFNRDVPQGREHRFTIRQEKVLFSFINKVINGFEDSQGFSCKNAVDVTDGVGEGVSSVVGDSSGSNPRLGFGGVSSKDDEVCDYC